MKITPLELRQYEFEKTFRGYNIEEVDMFIANLSQEWERVLNESKMLKMQLEIAEKEAAKLREIEVTLFRTLKTAEDTSTMITDQANLQAQKRISEANEKSEKLLQDANEYSQQQVTDAEAKAIEIVSNANTKSTEIITSAELQARHIQEDILEEVQSLERDFKAMQNYKANLLVQMRSLANATIEHVERFETKFDFDKIQQNITEASHLISTAQPIIVDSSEPLAIAEEVIISETEELSSAAEELQETVDDVIATDETINEEITEIATEVEKVEEEIALEIETPTITEEIEMAVQEEIIETNLIEDTIIDLPIEDKPVFEVEKETLASEELPSFVEEAEELVETPIINEIQETLEEINVETPIFEEEKIEENIIIENPISVEEKIIETPIIETPIIEAPVFEERRTILSSSVNNFVEESVTEVPIFKPSPATNNLELIQGITPEISQILNQSGIVTFRELATTPAYKVRQYLEDAGNEFSTINPTSWTEQALLAAEERWDELKVRQIELQKSAELVQEITTENIVPVAPISNLDNITEEMLEKVNKVKDAIRKAMIDKGEKAEMKVKDDGYLPTIDDVVNKVKKKSGSFFDNID
jgi:DivIVA domain-containing protein